MRPALVLAAAVALVAAGASGCTVKNPAYCDSPGDCAADQTCVLAGAGVTHVCVTGTADAPPPDAPLPPDASPPDAPIPCGDAGSCPAAFPICRAGHCELCATPTECPLTSPVCAEDGRCATCKNEGDCTPRPATPHCAADGSCVACRDKTDCGTAAPVCDGTVCRGCRVDDECPTFCNTDTGACVPSDQILFVVPGATGTTCASGDACGLIGTAVSRATGMRDWWIHVAQGTYAESLTLANLQVHIIGTGVLVVPGGGAPGAVVSGGSSVVLRGLGFHDAGPDATSDGIQCSGTSPAKTLLRLTSVSLSGNSGVGLRSEECAIVVEQTVVKGNGHQGLLISDSTFDIHDTVVTGNSDGVMLTNPATGTNHLDFDTIASNVSSGVSCNGPSPPLVFDSDIVYGNGDGAQVSGTFCSWIYSDIGPTAVAGTGNISASPMFTDSAFHIASTSPCVNAGDPAAPAGIDFEGDPRPAGGRADIGADETP